MMTTCTEAMAILAGDALQALAFTSLAGSLRGHLPADKILDMIAELGSASGVDGMAAGQAIDLQSVGQSLDLQGLEAMHRRKTGALIAASVTLGAMCSECVDETLLDRLRTFGNAVGLSFQIVDDILDVVGDTAVIGKTSGADIALNKPTFPSILGIEIRRSIRWKVWVRISTNCENSPDTWCSDQRNIQSTGCWCAIICAATLTTLFYCEGGASIPALRSHELYQQSFTSKSHQPGFTSNEQF
jgi:geranylgeranyl pyrophosphate synthase